MYYRQGMAKVLNKILANHQTDLNDVIHGENKGNLPVLKVPAVENNKLFTCY